MSDKPLVLITGGTGYIGAHIVQQALDAGYPVRLTAQPGPKADNLRNWYQGRVDVYAVADLVSGDYMEALEGVGALIHVATPLAGTESSESMLKISASYTADVQSAGLRPFAPRLNLLHNIVRQATTASVKRIVLTSSSITLANLNEGEGRYVYNVLTENSWNEDVTKEELFSGKHDGDPLWIYGAAKTLAEQALWEFADQHPDVDISTINPTLVYGPFAAGAKISKGDYKALSTAGLFYTNVLPANASSITVDRVRQVNIPASVDVRDVARAHILALSAPLSSEVGRKRFPITGPELTWVDAIIHLRKVMPELTSRLPKVAEGAESSERIPCPTVDTTRAKVVLGLDEFIDWKKTAEDTVKSLLVLGMVVIGATHTD